MLYILYTVLLTSLVSAQTITVTAQPDIAEWDMIYVLDAQKSFNPGEPILFSYRIDPGMNSVEGVDFHLSLYATALDLGFENSLIFSVDLSMDLQGPLVINNTKLNTSVKSDGLIDELGNTIKFNTFDYDGISNAESSGLLSKMIDGELPSGTYSFKLRVTAPSGTTVDYVGFNPDKVINIQKPEGFNLISPLDDEQIAIANPTFEWNSIGCDDYSIRICEYNPLFHSSADDAINSESSLPYPDNQSFYPVGDATSFLYEGIGRPLEVGKTYVWQVKKVCRTNSADKEITSQINRFTILETGRTDSPCQLQLRDVLGDSQYNILFGTNGPLEGYGDCAEITLDGERMSTTDFGALLIQLMNGVFDIESVTTQ